MKKDQIIILEERGLISVVGPDAKDFIQNIVSNDINKVNINNSIFSAIFTPQGKYLYEFFIIKSNEGFYLECDQNLVEEIIEYLLKFKLRSKVHIDNLSDKFVVGIISKEKFEEIQKSENSLNKTLLFRDSPCFLDPRTNLLGARILSSLEKLYLTIKKLSLTIINKDEYLKKSYMLGIPIEATDKLKDQLFGLEANFEELNAIDFKKGCYVGQENTARMKLKNKIRRRLFSINSEKELSIGSEIYFNEKSVGKVLINKPYAFALIKLFDPDIDSFSKEKLTSENLTVKIIKLPI
jgi:folate-binding protein YgfZ|tara:strand:- start:477 stop:1361 length:885 start_codon:yes stop_codon:yes gene_type:complete